VRWLLSQHWWLPDGNGGNAMMNACHDPSQQSLSRCSCTPTISGVIISANVMDERPNREHIPNSVRFEVFKRDSFTCQYCGRKAPEIVLQIEHITPVAHGGSSDILNLLTACVECNSGKGVRLLSETQAISKRHAQLEILQERREQLRMLSEWQQDLTALVNEEVDVVSDAFSEITGFQVNDHGRQQIRRWIKTYGAVEVLTATREAAERYFQSSDNQDEAKKSAEDVFNRIVRVVRWKRAQQRDPEKSQYLYAKGILRNRLNYVNWNQLEQIIDAWVSWSLTSEEFCELAKQCSSWTNFRHRISERIDRADRAEKAAQLASEAAALAEEVDADIQDDEIADEDDEVFESEDQRRERQKYDYALGYNDGERARPFYEEREVPDPVFEDGKHSALYRKGWWDGFNQLEYFDPTACRRGEEQPPSWAQADNNEG
jgi:23S rRNA U2552 (ribose-2'-O)-methylase RlmE/FtsJ